MVKNKKKSVNNRVKTSASSPKYYKIYSWALFVSKFFIYTM